MAESMYRLAPMTLVQMYVTIEVSRDIAFALGGTNHVHFRDLNSKLSAFQRTFISDVRRCDTVLSRIHSLQSMLAKYSVPSAELGQLPGLPSASEIDDIALDINSVFERVDHLDKAHDSLSETLISLHENRLVLIALNELHAADSSPFRSLIDGPLLGDSDSIESLPEIPDLGFDALCGAIDSDKLPLLRKILWRSLRGNLFMHGTQVATDRSVFIIYIHGTQLRLRARKVAQTLDAIFYDNALGDSRARNETLQDINRRIQDMTQVVAQTRDHVASDLTVFASLVASSHYIMERERRIFQILDMFDEDSTRRCLVAEGWVPTAYVPEVRETLRRVLREKSLDPTLPNSQETVSLSEESYFSIGPDDETYETADSSDNFIAVLNELQTNRTPPTLHQTNKFTQAFQLIIDAYGIATYQEINPGLAAIVTFPFMFAIMFGDVGHGFIVLLIALYLIINELAFGAMRNKDEIFEMAFNGRYIILLMGIFSMYTGLIYNDVFSKSMTLFKSGWHYTFPENYDPAIPTSLTAAYEGSTYPFGLDWAWHGAENNLLFTNSYKMKLSILMGFVHMNYSFFFSLVNYRFFKSRVDIVGNFIPGFLFMQSIFGYLTITIIYKWLVDWIGSNRQPPGLLNMLINMFLLPGTVEEQLYPGQKYIQIVLVLVALTCVPWLLIYKPMTLKRENNRAKMGGYANVNEYVNESTQVLEEDTAFNMDMPLGDDDSFRFPNDIEPLHHNSAAHGDEAGHFNFGDIVIHQVIHTIEFCLNCVSHTASYLRLWALSLAHAQLLLVLWTMTIQNAFGTEGALGICITVALFALWFVLTVCILVLMEGTLAMLHSLRLHWVEAMSKFFEGEGYAFVPFLFDSISDAT